MAAGAGTFELPTSNQEAPDEKAAREVEEQRERLRVACVAVLSEEAPLGIAKLVKAAKAEAGPVRGRYREAR